MIVGVIRYAVSMAAFLHYISVSLSGIVEGIWNFTECERCLIAARRINRYLSRIRQLSAVRAGYFEREFIAFLKCPACDDLLSFDNCGIRFCLIGIVEFQMFPIIVHRLCTQRSIQIIFYLDPNHMGIGIICYTFSASTFRHFISIGTHIVFREFDLIKFERCLVTTGRTYGFCSLFRQFTTIRAGHCEGKFISRLELTSCDDLLTF